MNEQNTPKMSQQEIEAELNKQFEQAYTIGYVSGLKSVLPFIEQSKTNLDNLINSINDYLKENDPHYGRDDVDIAKQTAQLSEELQTKSGF